jgi:hypothetical protein
MRLMNGVRELVAELVDDEADTFMILMRDALPNYLL